MSKHFDFPRKAQPVWILAVGVIAALLLLAGCGDDSSSEQASSPTTGESNQSSANQGEGEGNGNGGEKKSASGPRADFIAEADAACEKRRKELGSKGREILVGMDGASEQEVVRAISNRVVVPVFEGEIEDLKALTPPAEDQEEVEAIIVALEEMVANVKSGLKNEEYPYTDAENLANKYGLTACARP